MFRTRINPRWMVVALVSVPVVTLAGQSRYSSIGNGGATVTAIKTESQSEDWDLLSTGRQDNDLVLYSRKRGKVYVNRVAADGTRTVLSQTVVGNTFDLMTSGNVIGSNPDLILYDRLNGVLAVYEFGATGALNSAPTFSGALGANPGSGSMLNEYKHWTQLAVGSFTFNGFRFVSSIAAYSQGSGALKIYDYNTSSGLFSQVGGYAVSRAYDRMISGNFKSNNPIAQYPLLMATDELLLYNLDDGSASVQDLTAAFSMTEAQTFNGPGATEQALLIPGNFDSSATGDDLLVMDKNARGSSTIAQFRLQAGGSLGPVSVTTSWYQHWNLAVPLKQPGSTATDLWVYSYERFVPAVFLLVGGDSYGELGPNVKNSVGTITGPVTRTEADLWIDAVHRTFLPTGLDINWDTTHLAGGAFYWVWDTELNGLINGSGPAADGGTHPSRYAASRYADWFANDACLDCVFAVNSGCRDSFWTGAGLQPSSCSAIATGTCASACPTLPMDTGDCDSEPISKLVFIATGGNVVGGDDAEMSARNRRWVRLGNYDQFPKMSVHGLGHYMGLQHSSDAPASPTSIWSWDGDDSTLATCDDPGIQPPDGPESTDTSPSPGLGLLTGAAVCSDYFTWTSPGGFVLNPDRRQPMALSNPASNCTYASDPRFMYRLTLDQIRKVRETVLFRRTELLH